MIILVKRGGSLSKKDLQIGGRSNVVWIGRPSVSVFYVLYGLISLVIAAVLMGLELGSRAKRTSAGKYSRPIFQWEIP